MHFLEGGGGGGGEGGGRERAEEESDDGEIRLGWQEGEGATWAPWQQWEGWGIPPTAIKQVGPTASNYAESWFKTLSDNNALSMSTP